MRKLNNSLDLQDFKKVAFEIAGFKLFIEVMDIKELTGQSGKNYYLVKGIDPITQEGVYFYTSSMLTNVFEKEDLINCILSITYLGERRAKTSKFTYKIFDIFELDSDELAKIISKNQEKKVKA